jgi:hypothetical protein
MMLQGKVPDHIGDSMQKREYLCHNRFVNLTVEEWEIHNTPDGK